MENKECYTDMQQIWAIRGYKKMERTYYVIAYSRDEAIELWQRRVGRFYPDGVTIRAPSRIESLANADFLIGTMAR